MGIADFLSEDMVLLDLIADNKRNLLQKVAEIMAPKSGIDKNSIFEAILERESLGSTGYGNGIAFPHARIEGLDHIVTALVRLDKPIDFDSLDGKPVDLLAFMISPENSGEDHLKTLAAFSHTLKNEQSRQRIRGAKTAHEIYLAL